LPIAEELSQPAEKTFRDPQGRLYRDGDHILREIYSEHVESVLAWIGSPVARRWMQEGRLISTEVVWSEPGKRTLLEHERVFFPIYPWEWTPGQWKQAALLTLDLCEEALDSGYVLKDATPLNVLFSGPNAVFVDVLSFEGRDLRSPLWIAYGQFVRTFLLPLAAHVQLGWPLAATQHRRDGFEPTDLAPWLSLSGRWRSPMRTLVTVPLLLEGGFFQKNARIKSYRPKVAEDISAVILRRTLRKARRLLDQLRLQPHASRWSGYTETAFHYDAKDHTAKQDFVRRSLERAKPARVLDVGANTGVYSRIAAAAGASVVAWDSDVRATDINWETAFRTGSPILPVVANFARPTPAVGWQNSENLSLLSRGKGQFDCVMMLGILHHLLVADQIPLACVIDQVAQLSTRWAIIEWVPKNDSQFVELCRGREGLYEHLNEDLFIRVLSRKFVPRNRELLPNGRTLWLVEAVG
jgi:SAM-dependent methyltransferase